MSTPRITQILENSLASGAFKVDIQDTSVAVTNSTAASLKVEAVGTATTRVQATGTGAIATHVAPTGNWELRQIMIHLSAAGGAGNLTLTIASATGAAYNTVLLTQDMTAVTDLVWIPERPIFIASTDHLDVAWTNAGGKTFGLEVCYGVSA